MKIKALLLSFFILFTCFSFAELSYGADVDIVHDTEKLEFISQLGIDENVSLSRADKKITRAEFTELVIKTINNEYIQNENADFVDVQAEHEYAKAIYTAKKLGLIGGTSEAQFSPDSSIEPAAAVKIVMTALGYSRLADIYGGYPNGFIIVAGKLGVTTGIDISSSSLTAAPAVELIYNALHTELMTADTIIGDNIIYDSEDGENLLTKNHKLSLKKGIAQIAGLYSLVPGYSSVDNILDINGLSLKGGNLELERYIGLSVEAWYSDKTLELKAVDMPDGGSVATINAKDLGGYANNTLTSYADGKTKNYKIDTGFALCYNGSRKSLEGGDFNFKTGYVKLVDADRDNKYETILIFKKTYFVVSSMVNNTLSLYDKNLTRFTLSLDDDDGARKSLVEIYDSKTNTTSPGSFADIKPDMVIELYQSADLRVSKILAGDGSVSGAISEMGEESAVIGGVTYELNEYFTTNNSLDELGANAKFLIAPDGTLTIAASLLGSSGYYGYYLDYNYENAMNKKVQIKLMNESGEVVIYELADKISLNDRNNLKPYDTGLKDALISGTGYPIYQVIKYRVNDEDKIYHIDLANDISSYTDPVAKFVVTDGSKDSLTKYIKDLKYTYTNSMAAPYFSLSGCILFEVPKELSPAQGVNYKAPGTKRYEDSWFGVTSLSPLDGLELRLDAYDMQDSLSPAAVTIFKTEGGSAGGGVRLDKPQGTDTTYIVEEVNDAVDMEGTKTVRLYLCSLDGYVNYAVSGEYYTILKDMKDGSGNPDCKIPNAGDIVRISLNKNDEITYIARDGIWNGSALTIKFKDGIRNAMQSTATYVSGKVFKKGTTMFMLDTDNVPPLDFLPSSTILSQNHGLTMYRLGTNNVVVYNTKTNKARRATSDDILDMCTVGDGNQSYVCAKVNYLTSQVIFVYED